MKKYNSFLGAFFSGDNGQGGYNAAYGKSALAKLYTSQDPAEQQMAAEGLARVDPESAGKWQQEQAALRQEGLKRKALMFANLPKEEQVKMYPLLVPEIRKDWADAPDQYNDTIGAMVSAWAQSVSGGANKDKYAGAPFVVMENNKPVYYRYGPNGVEATGLSAPDQFQMIEGKDGYYRVPTKRSGDASAVNIGQNDGVTAPTPTTAPVGNGGVVFPSDVQGAAQRTQNIMTQVRQEIAALVAQGVPVDRATSQVTQKYAQGRGLAMPPVGQQPSPVQQTAPPVTQTAPPPMATGGQVRLESKSKDASRPATAEEKAAYGIPADVPAERKADGSINVINLPKNDQSASIANETNIRKEFAAQVKPYQEVISAYQRVETAANNPTAAGDLSMIFAYMKMLDPGSVVREGEFANAQNATGVPQQILNMYNKIRTGQRLSPEQRADFLNQARGLKVNAEKSYQQYEQQYRGIAQQYNIPADRIIVGPSVSTKPAGAGQPVRINSKEERDKLPPGTQYIGPDGKVSRKK